MIGSPAHDKLATCRARLVILQQMATICVHAYALTDQHGLSLRTHVGCKRCKPCTLPDQPLLKKGNSQATLLPFSAYKGRKEAYRQLHIEVSDQQLAGATARLCPHGIQLGLCLSLLLSSFPSQVLLCLQRSATFRYVYSST